MPERYTVVIPTTGRATLGRSITSAVAQTFPPEVVVVIGDHVDASVLPTALHDRVLFQRSYGTGVSAARNQGVAAADTPWVAFLDDDDEWLPAKMGVQLEGRDADDPTVILSAAWVRRGNRTDRRPAPGECLKAGHDVFERLYGSVSVGRSRTYLPMASVVVPRAVATEFPFDQDLTVREDIWWFHQLQRAGVSLEQMDEVLITCYASRQRARGRENVDSLSHWTERLGSVQRRYARNFLLGMALREAILARDPAKVGWTSSHGLRMLTRSG
jgi:glycosyltransferase involved in cell wall biosynthesis